MALTEGTYPPAPFLRGKGSKAPLMAYIASMPMQIRISHTEGIKRLKIPHTIPSQNPFAFPPSSQAQA